MYLTFTQLLTKTQKALNAQMPFVVFRKPNENSLQGYFQTNTELHELNSFEQAGFVFAPFNNSLKKVLFPAENCNYSIAEVEFEQVISEKIPGKTFVNYDENLKQQHIDLVNETIQYLKNSNIKKIVVSRTESHLFEPNSELRMLKKMLQNYPLAFVYFWYHPVIGSWLGATPETLLHCNGSTFNTMALAGTQIYKGTKQVVWHQKELQEQQYVVDYILKALKNTADRVQLSKLQTIKAGSLVHLKTDIFGNLKKGKTIGDLVKAIHPTPAICGIPKKAAFNFIIKNEGYNRSYYTGYLGILNVEKKSDLFVNLRCVELKNSKAHLYVGGGITEESQPESEWLETVSKAETIKKVL